MISKFSYIKHKRQGLYFDLDDGELASMAEHHESMADNATRLT